MGQEPITRMDRCRVCGRDDWLEVISFGSTPLANGFLDPAAVAAAEPSYPVEVVVCRGCWLMSLRHVVDPEVLFRQYCYVSSASQTMRAHMSRIVDWCTAKAGLVAGDTVVEMGSNVGTQLKLFQDNGMRVVGVDPARNLGRIAEAAGVPTITDFFGPEVTGPIAREHSAAKLVLARQCVAHVDDLHQVMKGVDAVLAPDGTLAIEVPYLVDLLDQNQFDTIYHEHLSYLSVGTLDRLFRAHGLQVVDVERADVHGGSVVVFAARTGSVGAAPGPAVAEILELERKRGLSDERTYLEFADRVRTVVAGIRELVRGLAADGQRIAGYGAPSKGTALLMACGLTPDEVRFCSDTTTLKHGKLLPGTHIPVWSPEQARANPPDCYLLLAWNYADEIIRNERAFLEQGGRFVIPIPQPRIVAARDVAATASGPEGANR
jgi:novobiocin biosynthesis protein NovU/D-mycarose 3-C-methyltransferase